MAPWLVLGQRMGEVNPSVGHFFVVDFLSFTK